MSSKKLAAELAAPGAHAISVDLDMSNAKLGATLRRLLGKLKPTEVITVAPERSDQSGKRWQGVMYRHKNIPMSLLQNSPRLKILSLKKG